MSETKAPFFQPARVAKDLAVVVPAYAFWVWVCHGHVPLQEPVARAIAAAFTAVPLTSTVWYAYHMLRVVVNHERAKKRAAGS
jgi:hypothetical protein